MITKAFVTYYSVTAICFYFIDSEESKSSNHPRAPEWAVGEGALAST